MNYRLERIREELKTVNFNQTKVMNYTGIDMQDYSDLTSDKADIDISEIKINILEFRLFNRQYRNLLF